MFQQSLYFQQQRGYTALYTGLLFLPMTGLVAVTSSFVARVVHRFGHLAPIVGGQLGMIAGLVALALLPVHARPCRVWVDDPGRAANHNLLLSLALGAPAAVRLSC